MESIFFNRLIEGSRPGQILYHSCTGHAFIHNCQTDSLTANEEFRHFKREGATNYGKGVSLSRYKNLNYAKQEGQSSFLYYLDADKISDNYKLVPYDYWWRPTNKGYYFRQREEGEERVVGDLKNLHRYIIKIEYTGSSSPFKEDWAYCSTGMYTHKGDPYVFEEQMHDVIEYLEKHNIPLENMSIADLEKAIA